MAQFRTRSEYNTIIDIIFRTLSRGCFWLQGKWERAVEEPGPMQQTVIKLRKFASDSILGQYCDTRARRGRRALFRVVSDNKVFKCWPKVVFS